MTAPGLPLPTLVEQENPEPTDLDAIIETLPVTTGRTANAVSARSRAAGLPLLAIGAAGTVAAAGIVLALSSQPEATPARAAAAPTVPASHPTAPSVVVDTAPPPTWSGRRQPGWGPDGSRSIVFELQATHDVPVWMSRARPVLVVRCQSRLTSAFVALGTSTTFESDAFHRTVQVQWQDGPLTVQQWQSSESGQELFAPDGVAFVRQLARGTRLRFGFTPFNAPAATAEFVVAGFGELAPLVAKTCGWKIDS